MTSKKFREIVFQLLFSIDRGDSLEEDLIPFLMKELEVAQSLVQSAYQKARAIWHLRDTLDQVLIERSKDYALNRIQYVEKNILRLGLYELLYEKELDKKIVITESIRLCRKFSTPEAGSYINAILDESALSTPKIEAVE